MTFFVQFKMTAYVLRAPAIILILCFFISSCNRRDLWENEFLNDDYDLAEVRLRSVTIDTTTDQMILKWDDPSSARVDHIEIIYEAGTEEVELGEQTKEIIYSFDTDMEYTITIRTADSSGNTSTGLSFSIITNSGEVQGYFIYIPYELYVIGKNEVGYESWTLNDFYYLMANVDLSTYNWTPIGTDTSPFTGTFKGNNHTIRNLTIPLATANYQGLFGYISGGTVKNLILTGVSVTGGTYSNIGGLAGYITNGTIINITLTDISISGANYLGGLVGYCRNGTVTNVTLSGNSNSISGTSVYSGGLIGYFSNTGSVTCGISNCSSSANVGIVSSSYYCGCLIGRVEITSAGIITIENCHASGNVEGISFIGGLTGHILNNSSTAGTVKITNCDAAVIVKGISEHAGGLIGSAYINTNCNGTIDISFCRATGNVTGNNRTGGLIGNCGYQDNASGAYVIDTCYATGAVEGNNHTGGLIGYCGVWLEEPASDDPSITHNIYRCYASGPVTATGAHTGGLIGYVCSSTTGTYVVDISECYYATGIVTGVTGTINAGGLVGSVDTSSIDNCYARGNVNGTDYLGGLVGRNSVDYLGGLLTNCYASGAVQNTGNYGGLAGGNSGTETACFYDISTTLCNGPLSDGLDFGTAATHNEMTADVLANPTNNIFYNAGWDFYPDGVDDIWTIDGSTNGGYPYFYAN